jgi:excisionase family DNA binding protein
VSGRLLTAREVAEQFGVTVETVLRWAAAGKLPSIRLSSRAIRFRQSAIAEWVEAHERGAAPRGVSPTHGNHAPTGAYAPLPSPVSPIPLPTGATTEED